jgi:hypothetical protein
MNIIFVENLEKELTTEQRLSLLEQGADLEGVNFIMFVHPSTVELTEYTIFDNETKKNKPIQVLKPKSATIRNLIDWEAGEVKIVNFSDAQYAMCIQYL